MGVTVLPYIDQTQTARLQEAASANIQTPKNTDEAVTTFKAVSYTHLTLPTNSRV